MKKTLLITLFASLLYVVGAKAQEKENLIPNGKFETYEKVLLPVEDPDEDPDEYIERLNPKAWIIQSKLSGELIVGKRDGGSGERVLKINAVKEGYFELLETSYSRRPIYFKPPKKYKLSFWAHPSKEGYSLEVTVKVFYSIPFKGKDKFEKKNISLKQGWNKYEFEFDVPEYYPKGGLNVKVLSGDETGNILFDDFEMYDAEEVAPEPEPEPTPTLSTPTGLRAITYQREMELSWDNVAGVNWEVKLDDAVVDTVNTNKYILEKLEVNKAYKISVRQIKGREFSDYAVINSSTKSLVKSADNINRIPYLRTIREDGILIGLNLQLYYDDLANKDAKITYYVDGAKVEPVKSVIKFPKAGVYKFKVIIEESEKDKFELIYRLVVQER